jgi:hypothetical protein
VPLVVAAQKAADARRVGSRAVTSDPSDEQVETGLVHMLHDEIVEPRSSKLKVFASTITDDIESVLAIILWCLAQFEPRADGFEVSFERMTLNGQLRNTRPAEGVGSV